MLSIGQIKARQCGGWTRRELVRAGALSAIGLSLVDLLRLEAHAQQPAPAKSTILLWLWGGPSHLDTFDMKPRAPVEFRGPYAPVATNVPGIEICELLPLLARRADRYTLVRSLNCSSNDHGIAGTIGLQILDDQLVIAAPFVQADTPACNHLHAVFGAKAQQCVVATKHGTAYLCFCIFQREIPMSGRGDG